MPLQRARTRTRKCFMLSAMDLLMDRESKSGRLRCRKRLWHRSQLSRAHACTRQLNAVAGVCQRKDVRDELQLSLRAALRSGDWLTPPPKSAIRTPREAPAERSP